MSNADSKPSHTKSRPNKQVPSIDYSQSGQWKLKDKESLVYGLRKHGFSNLEAVAQEIKTKTPAEVRYYCDQRYKRIQSKLKSNKFQEKCRLDSLTNASITVWCNKLKESIEPRIRGKDYTTNPLIEIMDEASKKEPGNPVPNGLPDFQLIYNYLKATLGGHIPPTLNPQESMVVLHLLNNLSKVITQNPFQEEKELLNSLPQRTSIEPKLQQHITLIDHFSHHKMSRKQGGDNEITEGTKYPKVKLRNHVGRQLISYINPLQIPLKLLSEEYRVINPSEK